METTRTFSTLHKPLWRNSELFLHCSHHHCKLVTHECTWLYLPYQFSSVTQSCLTLCNPMSCSMPGLPVHHQLPEFTQTHVHKYHLTPYPLPCGSVKWFSRKKTHDILVFGLEALRSPGEWWATWINERWVLSLFTSWIRWKLTQMEAVIKINHSQRLKNKKLNNYLHHYSQNTQKYASAYISCRCQFLERKTEIYFKKWQCFS